MTATAGGPSDCFESHVVEDQEKAKSWILGLVTLSIFMVSASGTILTIALPAVVRHFEASALESTWLLLAPLLVGTCLLVSFGRLADTIGRRGMYLVGLATFTLCALLSGMATSAAMLIVLSGVQAVGVAMVIGNTGAIVGALFSGQRLSWAMGIYMAGVSAAQVLGPSVGGAVADGLGWRWLYWTQVPLGIACVVLGAKYLGSLPPRAGRRRRLDVRGGLLLSVMLFSLLFGMSSIQSDGLLSWRVAAGLGIFLGLIPVLIALESRVLDPLLQWSLFRRRSFAYANLGNMLSMMPRFVSVMLAGLYFQAVTGDSALTAGLKVLPLPVGITVGSLLADRLARRCGLRRAGTYGAVLTSAGLVLLALGLSASWPYGWCAGAFVMIGLGAGIFATVSSTMVIREAPAGDMGTVNGIRVTLMNVGGSVAVAGGLALTTSTLPMSARADFYQAKLTEGTDLDALRLGFNLTFGVMVLIAVVSAAALFGARRSPAEE